MNKRIKNIITTILVTIITISTHVIPIYADDSILTDVVSDYVYLIDYESGQVLAEKNATDRIYPASMTKIMTALVSIEAITDMNQTITITNDMLDGLAEMNASVAGFEIGDEPTMLDLLYGLALPSGADAAQALAIYCYGSVDHFVYQMNQKAQSLGLSDTHFVNTTGLHDDDHYSTVVDIAKLLQYAITIPTFADIFSTDEYTTTPLSSHPNGITVSSTTFSSAQAYGFQIDGLIGAKSGFTSEAGHCLASWEYVNGMHLICVTAHADADSIYAPTHIQDIATILSHLQSYENQKLLSASEVLKNITLTDLFHTSTQTVFAPTDVSADVPMGTQIQYTTDLPDKIEITNDDQIISYTLTILVNDVPYQSYNQTITIAKDTNFFTRLLRNIYSLFQ